MHRKQLGALCLSAVFLQLAAVERVWGWNDAGHMVVNLVAYDLLDENTRREAVELLRRHPRFEQHFLGAMPQSIWTADEAQKNAWIFAFAGNWPDLVRDRSIVVTDEDATKFNRPNWHFVDFPVFISPAEEQSLAGSLHANLESKPPAERDSPSMNVMQAIKNSLRIVSDRTESDEMRAVHLCWLCHLVGDAHQPLHTSALYSTRRFPEGDHGGNQIIVNGQKTLHSYWDGRVLDIRDFRVIRRTAREMAGESSLKTAGQTATKELDPANWIAEGREIVRTSVYTEQIRQAVAAAEDQPNLPEFDLSADYDQEAGRVARRRVVVAGYRLAELIRESLKK